MMRVPINTELVHIAPGYDPAKAHKVFKGRKKESVQPSSSTNRMSPAQAKQKLALQHSITNLATQLGKLEKLIEEKETILHMDQAQVKVKARREKDKPAKAADQAKVDRENKSTKSKSQKPSDMTIANLKALATKSKGQLAVAKQKLAAL